MSTFDFKAATPTASIASSAFVFGADSQSDSNPKIYNASAFPLLASANIFSSAVQTVQGLTTTQPGWYAQVAGDAVPRVRVGLNSTDVASIGFGGGAGARDLFLERAGAANLRFGAPDAASPVAQTLSLQNVVAGTSNTAGAAYTIKGSAGTGTGAGGQIVFQTAPAGASGSSQNSYVTQAAIATNGVSFPNGVMSGAVVSYTNQQAMSFQ